ncbi:MAG: PAS domain S-box protein [Marinilabilia sp.]
MDEPEKSREKLLHEINAIRLKYNASDANHDASSVSLSKKDKEAILQREETFRLLMDLMPEGIYKVSKERRFLEVNPALVKILGYDSKEEVLSIEDVSQLYFTGEESEKALAGRKAEDITVFRVRRKDGSEIWVEDHGRPVFDDEGGILYYEGILRDITERKRKETFRDMGREVLAFLNETGDFHYDIKRVVNLIKKTTGFDAVGIRMKEEEDYPFFFTEGFPEDFLRKESSLVARNMDGGLCRDVNGNIRLECTCGQVISGKTDPSDPNITKGGSSWTNDSASFLQIPLDEDARNNPRNLCIHQGYASVAQVPVRAKGEIIGLLLLNDRKKGCFTLALVEILEDIACNIGEAFIRKQAEQNLKNREATYTKLLTHIGDVIFIVDREGISRYLSPNLEKLFGWKPSERLGKSVWDVVHPGDQPKIKEYIEILTEKSGLNKPLECRYKCKDGTFKWIEVLAGDFSEDPDINGFLGNFHDITGQKRNREKLVELKEKAEESDYLKSAFLANMSHEIRTPLNGIIGFIDLLQKPNLSEKQREQFSKLVRNSSDRLISTIDDIIAMSKISSGQCGIYLKEIDVEGLLQGLYGFFKPHADAKGLSLQLMENPGQTVKSFISDKGKLESILSQFIKNAIKFTGEGFVKFGVEKSENQLIFFVADSGIGIPPEKRDVIFEKFSQINVGHQRPYDGSGLGLSIAEGYCDILGGKIRVESRIEEGSTFYLYLDYEEPSPKAVPRKEINFKTENRVGDLILVVEDDEASCIYLEEVLTSNDFRVIQATNGEEAVRLVRENPDIGLVFMDVKMPVLDGYEATRQIRQFNKRVPVIAQTAFANAEEIEKMKRAGCDDYLTKPIDSEDLLKYVFEKIGK